MNDVAKFFTLEEAVSFCDTYKHHNLAIIKELDGRYHVYDLEGSAS